MGSLFSPSLPPPRPPQPLPPQPPPPPPPSLEISASNYRVYAAFCTRDPTTNTNICNWIECYNPSDNTWHRLSPIPGLLENHVLKCFAMVSIGDSIYVIGGRLCHKEGGRGSDDIVEVDLEVLPSVLRYNVCTNVWSKCAPLGVPRFDFACTTYDNKIYVAGGKCTLDNAKGISSTEVYDPVLNEWTPLPNLSTLRYKCVGVTWQGKIHVVGGFAEKEHSDQTVPFIKERSSAEVFNTERKEWHMVGMWRLDVPPNQIVAVDSRLFSSGDCLNAWKGHIEAYDGKLNIWYMVDGSHLHPLSSPVSTSDAANSNWPPIQRQYLTMASIGTSLYFLVGYRMPGELSRSMSVVHTFDTLTNSWKSFPSMEEEGDKELCSHCCVVRLE